jgi:hypothetical protein
MKEIAAMTQHIVDRAKSYDSDTIPGDFGELKRRARSAAARSRKPTRSSSARPATSRFGRSSPAASSSSDEIESPAATERKIGPLTGFRNKMGRPFNAIIKLNDDNAARVRLRPGRAATRAREPVDFSAQQPLGACPKCAGAVFEHGMAYVCEKSVGPEQELRLPLRQGHPAAADRTRADAEAAGEGRPICSRASCRAHAAQVLGLPGARQGRQGRLRVRESNCSLAPPTSCGAF